MWIAPSGGRDRPDPNTGDWLPHRYDPGRHSVTTDFSLQLLLAALHQQLLYAICDFCSVHALLHCVLISKCGSLDIDYFSPFFLCDLAPASPTTLFLPWALPPQQSHVWWGSLLCSTPHEVTCATLHPTQLLAHVLHLKQATCPLRRQPCTYCLQFVCHIPYNSTCLYTQPAFAGMQGLYPVMRMLA